MLFLHTDQPKGFYQLIPPSVYTSRCPLTTPDPNYSCLLRRRAWGGVRGRGMSTRHRMLSRELKFRAQQSVVERRRLVAANLFALGLSASAVAHRLGVSRQSAHRWYRAWGAGGSRHYALTARSAGAAGCCVRSSTRLSTPCYREPVPTGSLATRWGAVPLLTRSWTNYWRSSFICSS